MSDKRPTIEVHAEVPTPDAVRTFYEVPDAVASQIGVLDHKASFVENLVSLLAGKAYAVEAVNVAAIHHVDKMRDLRDQHNSETRKDCESGCDTHRTCREDRGPCTHGLTAGRGTAERCLECGEAVGEPRPENPYRTVHARMSPPGAAWDEGFAACRAAFDAVVAERDEAIEAVKVAAVHHVEKMRELRAERDAAITAGQKLADAVENWIAVTDEDPEFITTLSAGDNERAALSAFRSAVSGSSEPRKENE